MSRSTATLAALLLAAGVASAQPRVPDIVLVNGERWNATAEEGHLEEGAHVLVTSVNGLQVTVKRDPASLKLLPAGPVQPEA